MCRLYSAICSDIVFQGLIVRGEMMTKKRVLDLDKVIDKAGEMIETQGLAAMTMPNLAKALNIRSQSLYHYVANRHQLLTFIIQKRLEMMNDKLVKNLVGLSGVKAVLCFADIVRETLLKDKALAAIMFQIDQYAEGSNDAAHKELEKTVTLMDQVDANLKDRLSLHTLIGAVLGYVFFDITPSTLFARENEKQATQNYHKMILRLVDPTAQIKKGQ